MAGYLDTYAFIGKGWSFPPEFDLSTTNNRMVTGAVDISESLMMILSTTPGDRVMFPKYGCGINKMVFTAGNNIQFTFMKNLIRNAITLYEQRVDLLDITVTPDDNNLDLLYVHVEYVIRETNSRGNLVYPFYLTEGTNVSVKLLK